MTGDESMCVGKKAFTTYWQAVKSARTLNRSRDNARGNVYRCPHCKYYHCGNTLGKKPVKRQSRHDARFVRIEGEADE